MKILKTQRSYIRKTLIGTLIVVTTMAMALPQNGYAMLAPAQGFDQVNETNTTRIDDLKTIQTALESKIIRQRLGELKLTPEQIDTRLSRLSDAQIHQTAAEIRTVSPGGDAGLGILTSLLVIGILVLLFFYLFKRV